MISVLLTLVVVGFLVWLLVTYVPLPTPIKTVAIVFVVICLILWLMSIFGIMDIPVPHLRGR